MFKSKIGIMGVGTVDCDNYPERRCKYFERELLQSKFQPKIRSAFDWLHCLDRCPGQGSPRTHDRHRFHSSQQLSPAVAMGRTPGAWPPSKGASDLRTASRCSDKQVALDIVTICCYMIYICTYDLHDVPIQSRTESNPESSREPHIDLVLLVVASVCFGHSEVVLKGKRANEASAEPTQ